MMQGRGRVPPPVPRKKPKLENVDSKTKEYSPSDSVYHVPKEQLLACEDLLRLPILYDDIGEVLFIYFIFFFVVQLI